VRYTVNHLFFFLLVRFKQPVPNDKGGTVILVDVFRLRSVVNAMIGRGGKNVFEESMQLPDVFCVNPELKENSDLVSHEDNDWVKAHKSDRKNENDFDVLHPAQPERYGEVVVFTGVMDDVRSPEEAKPVRDIVRPVTEEIKNDIAGDEGPPPQGHSPRDQIVDSDKDQK
jgi:hypothetical protein